MKRSAIRCAAGDATHYLWLDGHLNYEFMLTIADLLESDDLSRACERDQVNGGYWLWYVIHRFFTSRYGGRSNGVFTSYVLFEDAKYEPLLSITSDGHCQLIDASGEALSAPYAFKNMAEMIRLVAMQESNADLGMLYAWLDVEEEI